MLQTIAAFHAQQIDNLLVAYDVIANSIRNSQVPALDKLEKDVQATLLLTSIITIVLVIRPLRRVVLQTLEAILTIGLLLALISLVLGLPFCKFPHTSVVARQRRCMRTHMVVANEAQCPAAPFPCLRCLLHCRQRDYLPQHISATNLPSATGGAGVF